MKRFFTLMLFFALIGCGVNYPIQESIDTTPPKVVSVNPGNSGTGVAVNRAIVVTFSEDVDASSIGNASLTLSANGVAVQGTYSVSGNTVTFTPSEALSTNTTYNAKAGSGVKDLAGNALDSDYTWSFATGSQTDFTPPQVSSVSPVNGATDVSVNATITVTFSEPVSASTLTSDTFTVSGPSGAVTGTFSVTDSMLTFTPSTPLGYGTTYTVTVTTGVTDLAGNALTSNYTWGFTTVAQGVTDTTPPEVGSASPANSATDISLTTVIVAVFNEAIEPDTGTIAVTKNGTPVSGYVSYTNYRIIFNPSGNLLPNTVYTVTVSGVKDLAGNAMGGSYVWSFTTRAISAPLSIAGGNWHSLAVKSDGTVKTWGDNGFAQLGNGTYVDANAPVPVSGLSGISKVSAGAYHTLALKNDGTVWVWGSNEYGLGDGASTKSTTPVQVSGLASVDAISSNGGGGHSLALKNDGTVWAWGRNTWGELGDGSTTDRAIPVQVYGLTNVTAISAGGSHSLVLKGDGTVWAWGNNQYGQLGQGVTWGTYYTPVQVSGLTNVTAISAGGSHSLVLKGDGTVWAWGNNQYGQLGDGTTMDRTSPVQVSGITGVKAVAAGGGHALALKGDGTVWAWGDNQYGQLGIGSTPPNTSLFPTQVFTDSGLTSAISIGIGRNHSFAVKGDGTLWSWGMNIDGQLGIGNNTTWTGPAQVAGF